MNTSFSFLDTQPSPASAHHSRLANSRLARALRAFTRLDLLIVLATVGLMAAVVAPVLANSRPRSELVACFNNLRRIGIAFQSWANEHEDRNLYLVPPSKGGTFQAPFAPNAWFHFAVLSNELGTPKILACPSDNSRVASDFSISPTFGFLHPNFRNSAVSYFVGHPYEEFPRDVLSGDRNVEINGATSCSVFNTAAYVYLRPYYQFSWKGSIHVNSGNLLFGDGAVEQYSNASRSRIVILEDNGLLHFLMPR